MSFDFTISASISTGNGPLFVVFNVLDAASSLTTNEFHDCDFKWNFGDTAGDLSTSSPTAWTYGTRTGAGSKNVAYGPIAAHVFEPALGSGTTNYTVTCYGWDGATAVTRTKTISVTDADTHWSGTNTICISPANNFTGAPSGSTHNTSATTIGDIDNLIASGTRILLHRGEIWTGNSNQFIVGISDFMLGSYGSGAKPILRTTDTADNSYLFLLNGTTSDVRFVDLDVDGQSDGHRALMAGTNIVGTNILFLRCDIHDIGYGINLSEDSFITNAPNGMAFVDGSILRIVSLGGNNAPIGVRFVGKNQMIVGNNLDDSTAASSEHLLRTHWTDMGVIGNNSIANVKTGKEMIALRSVIDPDTGKWGLTGDNITTRYVVVSENDVEVNTYCGAQMAYNGDGSTKQRWLDIIIERNYFTCVSASSEMVRCLGDRVSVRNNISNSDIGIIGIDNEDVTGKAGLVAPTFVWSYHNTLVGQNNVNSTFINMNNGSNHVATNNFAYEPASGTAVVTTGSFASEGNNTSDAQMNGTYSPTPVATFPPTAIADYALSSGSQARGAGSTGIAVFRDFYGNFRDATTVDLGAIAFTQGSEPFGASGSNPITFKGSKQGHRGIGLFK